MTEPVQGVTRGAGAGTAVAAAGAAVAAAGAAVTGSRARTFVFVEKKPSHWRRDRDNN